MSRSDNRKHDDRERLPLETDLERLLLGGDVHCLLDEATVNTPDDDRGLHTFVSASMNARSYNDITSRRPSSRARVTRRPSAA
jgi:hypothetical protein